jgi:hypothetical protein
MGMYLHGEVAEWSKAAAWEGCYAGNRIGGSNPSPLRVPNLAQKRANDPFVACRE